MRPEKYEWVAIGDYDGFDLPDTYIDENYIVWLKVINPECDCEVINNISNQLQDQEQHILNLLADVWDKFTKLQTIHKWDQVEFMHAIHAAQNIIMSRPAMRDIWQ